MAASFMEYFAVILDPRIERCKRHPLLDSLSVCAVLVGAEDWEDIEEFGYAKLTGLRQYVPLA